MSTKFPVLLSNIVGFNVAATNFHTMTSLANTANEAAAQSQLPVAMIVTEMHVRLSTAPGAGASWTVELRKNGTSVATVTISDAATTGSWTGTASFGQGDLIAYQTIPSGAAPAAHTDSAIGIMCETTDDSCIMFGGSTSGMSTTLPAYANPGYVSAASITSIEGLRMIAPGAGTVNAVDVKSNGSPGAGKSYTFTLVKNGVDTALTFSVSDLASSAHITSSVSFIAGDTLYWRVDPTGTPAARQFRITIAYTPEVHGESYYTTAVGGSSTASSNTQSFNTAVTSQSSWSVGEAARDSMLAMSVSFTRMWLDMPTAPGVGKTHTVALRQNAVDTALITTIIDSAVSGSVNATVALNGGDFMAIRRVGTGGPTGSIVHTSFVINTPQILGNQGNFLAFLGAP